MRSLTKKQKIISGAVGVVLAATGIGIGATMGGGASTTPSKATTLSGSVLTGKPGTAGRVLVVKIDNVRPARPAVGTNADIVYAIQVEGGLSRLMAVYDTHAGIPSTVGPVRSARETDLDILAAYNHPALAYSGAVTPLQRIINRDPLIVNVQSGYFRNSSRFAPHNEFIHTSGVANRAGVAKDIGLRFGAAPAGGVFANSRSVFMPHASFRFVWNGSHYNVHMDGSSSPWTADTVVIQGVHVGRSPSGFQDCNGGSGCETEPFSQTVGHGSATFLRNGRAYNGTWSRGSKYAPTKYTYNGKVMPLHIGRTWIVLAPQ